MNKRILDIFLIIMIILSTSFAIFQLIDIVEIILN